MSSVSAKNAVRTNASKTTMYTYHVAFEYTDAVSLKQVVADGIVNMTYKIVVDRHYQALRNILVSKSKSVDKSIQVISLSLISIENMVQINGMESIDLPS